MSMTIVKMFSMVSMQRVLAMFVLVFSSDIFVYQL